MGTYYHLDSGGAFTNLQLYALRQATDAWKSIRADYDKWGEDTDQLRERCVFAVSTLGLSIAQLLGQNNPRPTAGVPSPKDLLASIADEHELDPQLVDDFERLNYFYNGCRHFGKTTSGKGHRRVDELTFQVTEECFDVGLRIWRALLEAFGRHRENDLDDLDIDNERHLSEVFYTPDEDSM